MYSPLNLVLLLLLCFESVYNAEDLLVTTTSGQVRGITLESKNSKPVNCFLGIPYAEPPLRKLRFKLPEEIRPWKDVFNATRLPDSCPQRLVPIARFHPHLRKQIPTTPFNEDCLKLNFWVPVGTKSTDKLPVIAYIHGGGFSYGSSTVTTNLGDVLASEEGVIFASMNYRLGSLGFAYLNHSEAPGNVGISDQKLALQWIAKNAQAFGGDPENLVLVGESAGATSVLFHLLGDKDLEKAINRVVLLSAAVKAKIIMSKEDNYRKSLLMASNAGCPVKDTLETIECLRGIEADDLLTSEPTDKGYAFLNFFPIIDGKIVEDKLENLIKMKGKLTKKDLLIGTSRDEGTIFMVLLDPFVFSITSQTVKPSYDVARTQIREIYTNISDLGVAMIDYHYTNWLDLDKPETIFNAIKNLINDYLFTCGAETIADAYDKTGASVYKYFNTHYPPSSFAPKWFGAYHGSQNIYLFGDLYSHSPKLEPSEYEFSKKLMRYLANFARTGNPNTDRNGDKNQQYPEWPAYDVNNKDYLVWAPNSSAIGSKLRQKHCGFWRELMPQVANQTGFILD